MRKKYLKEMREVNNILKESKAGEIMRRLPSKAKKYLVPSAISDDSKVITIKDWSQLEKEHKKESSKGYLLAFNKNKFDKYIPFSNIEPGYKIKKFFEEGHDELYLVTGGKKGKKARSQRVTRDIQVNTEKERVAKELFAAKFPEIISKYLVKTAQKISDELKSNEGLALALGTGGKEGSDVGKFKETVNNFNDVINAFTNNSSYNIQLYFISEFLDRSEIEKDFEQGADESPSDYKKRIKGIVAERYSKSGARIALDAIKNYLKKRNLI